MEKAKVTENMVAVLTVLAGREDGKGFAREVLADERLKGKTFNGVNATLAAAAGKGLYVGAGNSEFGLNPIIDEIARMDDEEYNSVVFEEYDELYMYFFGVALFFLVLEMLIGERRSKYHLFKR